MIPYFEITEINLGFFSIHTWGLMVALGFVAGIIVAISEAKRKKLNPDHIYNLSILIILGSFIGARLVYIILFFADYQNNLISILKFWEGGYVFYGGLIGAIISAAIYIKIKKIDFLQYADAIAPGVALGLGIGRIGCSLINDHPGSVTGWPWGIEWPDGVVRHPVAEYLSLNGLIAFLLLWLLRKRISTVGTLFFIFITYYSITRFFLDFTRAKELVLPNADPHYFGLTVSQYISIILLIGSLSWFYWRYFIKPKKVTNHGK